MKRFQIVFVAAFMIMVMGLSEVIAQETFKLSVPLPLSGKKKEFAQIMKRSMLIGLREFNDNGGFQKGVLKGKKLELIFEDTGGDKKKVKEIAKRLIVEDKTPILYGFYGSSSSWIVAQIAAKYGVPHLIQTGSADKITQQGWKNVFRMLACNSQDPAGLNDFLVKVVKPKTIAIIHEPSSYGTGLAEIIRKFSVQEGIKVVYNKSYEDKITNFRSILLEVKQQNPEVIFMACYLEEAILIMRQAKELGINPKLFAGGGAGFVMPEFGKRAGEAAEYFVSTASWSPGVKYPGAREFAEKYRARYGNIPTYHGARAYASFSILIDALERTASLSPEDLIAALKQTDMMTAFGPVKFEDYENFTNQNRLLTLVMQWQDGKLVTIWPRKFAERKYRYPVPKWSKR